MTCGGLITGYVVVVVLLLKPCYGIIFVDYGDYVHEIYSTIVLQQFFVG